MSDISVGTLGGSTAAQEAPSSTTLQGFDKDTFLQLLVAQVKYQNPMEPTSSMEFLSQAAQYAGIEQLQRVAEGQAELRSMQLVVIATSMIGQNVTALDEIADELVSGVVESVRFGAEPMLVIDGREIPLSAVTTVNNQAPSTDSTITPDQSPTPAETPAA